MVQLGYADLVKASLEKEGLRSKFSEVYPEPHLEMADG